MATLSWSVIEQQEEVEREIKESNKSTSRRDNILLEKGYYEGTLSEVRARQSRNGDPQLLLEFKEEKTGATVANFVTFSYAGYEYAMKDIIRTGVPVQLLPTVTVDEDLGTVETDEYEMTEVLHEHAVGFPFKFGVDVDTYDGKQRNKIFWFMRNTEKEEELREELRDYAHADDPGSSLFGF